MWNLYDQLSPEHKFDEALSQYNRTLLQFLYNRDIREVSAIEQFLNPSLSFLSPITKLTNIKKIVDLIENSISSGKRIYIHGDYDVDGMSAVAILWKYLHNVRKANVMPYIPDRVEEGYGLSESSLSFIYDKGVDLIITVDCGIRDHDIIEKWKDKNIDFIVTDHHQLPEVLPDCPIVHPELSKDKVFSGISGATVAWLLVCAMEYFSNKDEFSYTNVAGVDLVGISILSDVMDSRWINRHLLSAGMEQLRSSQRPGIVALFRNSNLEPLKIKSEDLQFQIIPKLNAVGRIGDPLDAVRLLVTDSEQVAERYAQKISKVNENRKEMSNQIALMADKQIKVRGSELSIQWAVGEGWHEGIIGIVASKMSHQYNKTSVIIAKKPDVSTGSIRAVGDFSIVSLLEKLDDHLVRYGGHDKAAGFSIKSENIDNFMSLLENLVPKMSETPSQKLKAEMKLGVDELSMKLFLTESMLEPFGDMNDKPLYWVNNAKVKDLKVVGGSHLRFTIYGDFNEIVCIAFGFGRLYNKIIDVSQVDLLGYLDINEWNGNQSLQFRVIDIEL